MAAILELDEHLQRDFTIFEAAPQVRLTQYPPEYLPGFLWTCYRKAKPTMHIVYMPILSMCKLLGKSTLV